MSIVYALLGVVVSLGLLTGSFKARRNRRTAGFTLVEILIIMVILGILAAIVIPEFSGTKQTKAAGKLVQITSALREKIEVARKDNYPILINVPVNPFTQGSTVKADNTGDWKYVPETGEFRACVPQRIYSRAKELGISEDDVVSR